jgi:hypothetical protein
MAKRYVHIENFKNEIRQTEPSELIERWLNDGKPCAFLSADDLDKFTGKIAIDYPDAQSIKIAGTSNWQYSLNPEKGFSEFHERSDIDVIIVSPADFEKTWNILRSLHRKHWYSWGKTLRDKVLRTGQNIYCGFVSPKHIPDNTSNYRFEFIQRCNSYSTTLVGYRDVNLMFFKCDDDVVDYYIRGLRIARSKV